MAPPPPAYDGTGIEYHTIPTFKFSSGVTLHDLKVAYRSFNPTSTRGTVLIPTCFSGKINGTLTFNSGLASALAEYHVVVVAMLGNGESASPSNKPFFPEIGHLRYSDVVSAQYDLITNGLGIKQLEAVIGFSMGGQQAYHWAIMFPDFVKRIVVICSSARTSPHNYAFLEGPIAALTSSIDYIAWKQVQQKLAQGEDVGEKLKEVRPTKGLAAWGRSYAAWLTSAEWFRDHEWMTLGCENVEEWLEQRETGYASWNPDDLLVKARMWQQADIGITKDGNLTSLSCPPQDDHLLSKALRSITAKVLLMPCRSDQYFRPADNEKELQDLQYGTLEIIESTWGHTAGGGLNDTDTSFMNARIVEHMNR